MMISLRVNLKSSKRIRTNNLFGSEEQTLDQRREKDYAEVALA